MPHMLDVVMAIRRGSSTYVLMSPSRFGIAECLQSITFGIAQGLVLVAFLLVNYWQPCTLRFLIDSFGRLAWREFPPMGRKVRPHHG